MGNGKQGGAPMITENSGPKHFDVWRGWGDWVLRSLLVAGLCFTGKSLIENRPWRGVIVGIQSETVEPTGLDESAVHPRFKSEPKPLAWAVPR